MANVKLDELELASLRGELQDVSCSLNFEAQTGRGKLSLLSPRYSGLSGDSLSGGFRCGGQLMAPPLGQQRDCALGKCAFFNFSRSS